MPDNERTIYVTVVLKIQNWSTRAEMAEMAELDSDWLGDTALLDSVKAFDQEDSAIYYGVDMDDPKGRRIVDAVWALPA
jgi:hypothetical protein